MRENDLPTIARAARSAMRMVRRVGVAGSDGIAEASAGNIHIGLVHIPPAPQQGGSLVTMATSPRLTLLAAQCRSTTVLWPLRIVTAIVISRSVIGVAAAAILTMGLARRSFAPLRRTEP